MTSPREISLDRLALGGDAVGRRPAPAGPPGANEVVFVPYGAPGDRVRLGREEKQKNFSRAWIDEVLAPSPDRVEPRCPVFHRPGGTSAACGGCDWQHLSYARQTAAKRSLLIESFQRIGKIARPPVEETIGVSGAEGPWRYRNKVQIPFALGPDGKITGGFYAPSSRTVVPFEDCPVQSALSVGLFRRVRDWFRVRPVAVYDPATGRGWLRHLLVRTTATGEALVALVTQAGPVPSDLVEALRDRSLGVTSLYQNINTLTGSAVLSGRWRHLGGKPYIEETLLGLRLRLSPGAFFQVHHAMAERLYALAVDMAAPTPKDAVWELYAGVGAIGLLLARRAGRVVAVEENPGAVRDGIESARWNGLDNIRFRVGRCEELAARLPEPPAAVVLDPPRAGCDARVLKAVMARRPRRIVYVSCDPATLARDARYLSTGGYLLKRAVPVDLFPQTSHIESVSLFEPAAPGADPIALESAERPAPAVGTAHARPPFPQKRFARPAFDAGRKFGGRSNRAGKKPPRDRSFDGPRDRPFPGKPEGSGPRAPRGRDERRARPGDPRFRPSDRPGPRFGGKKRFRRS